MGDPVEFFNQVRRILIPTIAFASMLVMVIFSFDPRQITTNPELLSLFSNAVLIGSVSGVISIFLMLAKRDRVAAKDLPVAAFVAAISILMTDGNSENFMSEEELYAFLIMMVLWFGLIRLMKEGLE